MITFENGKHRYFDKHGREITEGCTREVYRTNQDELGTDATNPKWIESGRAVSCEFGIYPLEYDETNEVEVIDRR